MKRLLLFVILLSYPALAQSDEHRWSIGAGVPFFSLSLGVPVSVLGVSSAAQPALPSIYASLERRLDQRSALVLVADGSIVSSTDSAGGIDSTTVVRSLGLGGGIRSRTSREGAPVVFSLLALAHFGYGSIGFGTATAPTNTAWDLSLLGGISAERELVESLSVRLSAIVVSAGYTRRDNENNGGGSLAPSQHAVHVGFGLTPSAEIRLAF